MQEKISQPLSIRQSVVLGLTGQLIALGSLWIAGSCSQNAFNEAFQERFAPFFHVMNELKKARRGGVFPARSLGAVSTKNVTKTRTLLWYSMHFTKAILIVIPCEFTLAMMNHGMGIAPSFQPSVDVVLVGINERVRG